MYFLVLRDLQVRYKQTLFGVAWALIQPLGLMLVFSAVLGRVSGIRPSDVPYPLFVLAGIVPWNLFSQSLLASSNSLLASSSLLTKVYFPRLLLPLSAAVSHVLDGLIGALLLLGVAWATGYPPNERWPALLPILMIGFVASVGLGLWLAAVNVRYRDVRYAVPFLIQIGFFATPIAYSLDSLPQGLRILSWLNPMTGVVEASRWVFTGRGDDIVSSLIVSIGVGLLILISGAAYFTRTERMFADVV
jgi:lipopolysaccharide transport system permease protein